MRVFFIALLIALLPVRGWVGDAMAISMAGTAAGGHAAMAMTGVGADLADEHGHHAGMEAGMDHAAPVDHSLHASADDHAGSEVHSHSACDVCNGPVLTVTDRSQEVARLSMGLRADPVETFISSVPRAGHKPPIS